jgi:hypothetical protein
MSGRQELQIEITPDGEVKLTVKGAAGDACLDLTRQLEEELGVVVDRQKTSEFYQSENTVTDVVTVGED